MHRQGSRITLLTGLAAVTLSMLASPAGAAFPGRNGRIVVPSNRSGNFELWTVKANGTGWQQLTDHLDLGITLPEGDYATPAGLVLDRMGRIPEKGDAVDVDGWRLEVLDVDRRAITRVRLVHL
jgi:Transporter associated domain